MHQFEVFAHGVRLIGIATKRVSDVNAAHLAVHGVLASAMAKPEDQVSADGLNRALDKALREQSAGGR